MDQKPFYVRFNVLGDAAKPTLVLVHGYMCNGVSPFVQWLKYLTPFYRIVVFDNCGWGLNTRLTECSGSASPEAAELWLMDFMDKTMSALDLPPQFYIVGHSMGGYLSSLYASQHPERIRALFCVSSAGMETYDPSNYHPERYPDFDEPTQYVSPKTIKAALHKEASKEHPMSVLTKLKPEVAASIIENNVRSQILTDPELSEEQAQTIVDYQVHMFTRLSILEVVEVMPLKFPFLARHPMTAPDRLGNPRINFPIAHAFGDMDFFGSEGAEDVVRQNTQFALGRSQLFRVENCTHFMITDQPKKMFELMHGFF